MLEKNWWIKRKNQWFIGSKQTNQKSIGIKNVWNRAIKTRSWLK
jgi:hypothetical protein